VWEGAVALALPAQELSVSEAPAKSVLDGDALTARSFLGEERGRSAAAALQSEGFLLQANPDAQGLGEIDALLGESARELSRVTHRLLLACGEQLSIMSGGLDRTLLVGISTASREDHLTLSALLIGHSSLNALLVLAHDVEPGATASEALLDTIVERVERTLAAVLSAANRLIATACRYGDENDRHGVS